MKWYYADEGQQAGPFDETEIRKLADAGKISAETLVWHTGLSEWQPYRRIINRGLEIKEKTVGGLTDSDDRSEEDSTLSESSIKVSPEEMPLCSECGRLFPEEEMIRYGNVFICAACNPGFIRKIKEGSETGLQYAGFWIRFCAKMTDDIILLAATLSVIYLMEKSGYSVLEIPDLLAVVFYLIAIVYEVWFLEKFGATPGKTAFKLKALTSAGGKISYLRASARFFARELSGLVFYLGYIMAAFDSQKRTLHDRICDTRVIRKKS